MSALAKIERFLEKLILAAFEQIWSLGLEGEYGRNVEERTVSPGLEERLIPGILQQYIRNTMHNARVSIRR